MTESGYLYKSWASQPASHETVQQIMQKLLHIGSVWKITVPSKIEKGDLLLCYEPGIPSLMKFVKAQRCPRVEMEAFWEAFRN